MSEEMEIQREELTCPSFYPDPTDFDLSSFITLGQGIILSLRAATALRWFLCLYLSLCIDCILEPSFLPLLVFLLFAWIWQFFYLKV
jgi:hypothetical protein